MRFWATRSVCVTLIVESTGIKKNADARDAFSSGLHCQYVIIWKTGLYKDKIYF